jgi:hypothetical protein
MAGEEYNDDFEQPTFLLGHPGSQTRLEPTLHRLEKIGAKFRLGLTLRDAFGKRRNLGSKTAPAVRGP